MTHHAVAVVNGHGQLLKVPTGFLLIEASTQVANVLVQVSHVGKFSNDTEVLFSDKHAAKGYDVVVVKAAQVHDLFLDKAGYLGRLRVWGVGCTRALSYQVASLDEFDGNLLICVVVHCEHDKSVRSPINVLDLRRGHCLPSRTQRYNMIDHELM